MINDTYIDEYNLCINIIKNFVPHDKDQVMHLVDEYSEILSSIALGLAIGLPRIILPIHSPPEILEFFDGNGFSIERDYIFSEIIFIPEYKNDTDNII